MSNIVKLVTKNGVMSEEDKELSYVYLDQLREWIKDGKISAWLYVGVSPDTVFNAAVSPHTDVYRIIGVMEATKQTLIYNSTMFEDDD